MSETRRIQLHLGKCIEDLDKLHNVPDLKSKKAKILCRTAQKLFENAENYAKKGDEESSYVSYMKYLRIIAYLSKDTEYQNDKTYYNNMLGLKNPNKAIDAAEKLKASLIERYTKEHETKRLNDITEHELIKQKIDENRKKVMETISMPEAAPGFTLPGPDEVTIKSEQLYAILKASKFRVMILDARPGADFVMSHINHPACCSVPEEHISPGKSANVLEQSLSPEARAVWAERANMELIVMLDWNCTKLIPGNTLHLLKTILLKWDVKVQYRREPVALIGGYEDWLLKYPALTTNPRVSPPHPVPQLLMLGDIDYPLWSDLSPPAIVAQPVTVTRNRGPNEPAVDRASKAAAVQVYAERSRNMQNILEQQEKIADTSLTLEMQRIEAEQDWDKVRKQRELEQQEELRALYSLREQEIISQLMQLENKQFDMEQENQTLREQLEEYQRREREESEKLAETIAHSQQGMEPDDEQAADNQKLLEEQQNAAAEMAAKRARIHEVALQRDQLDRTREQLEGQRLRKLAEARARGKPHIDRDDDGDSYMISQSDDGMSKSQSSPNMIKDMMSSELESSTIPNVDRSSKPIPSLEHARKRDLQPQWGDVESSYPFLTKKVKYDNEPNCNNTKLNFEWRSISTLLAEQGRGLTGLKNLGNTCYMNSIIQCLNNTAILVSYFCSGQYLEHINRSHPTRGAIAEEVAAVVRALWSGQYRFIAIKDLRSEVGKHHRQFRGCDQQDSHEFLTILMDWLHDDLQFTIKPPTKDNLAPPEKAWHSYTKLRESLILRCFYGQIRSTVRCVQCGCQSATYESFSNLSLELPTAHIRCTLADCLKLYQNGETIPGWNCPSCKEKRDAVKKLDISRLPPVLVIHFKRFYVDPKEYSYNVYKKKQTYIDFPLDDLDMGQFSLDCPGNNVYNLYAVSNHYGSMEGGHYTAYCKSSVYGKWHKYDDHVVSDISSNEVKSSAAYILFYTSCGPL